MHLLIVMRSKGYYRFVESIAEEIAARDGTVTIVSRDIAALLTRVGEPIPGYLSLVEMKPSLGWRHSLLRLTRELRSYRHWLRLRAQPEFLLERWRTFLPRPVRSLLRLAHQLKLDALLTNRLVEQVLSWFENAVPPAGNVVDQIREIRPDVVLITPLLYPNAWEIDYLKACQRLGLQHAALIASWDNLSSKGMFHLRPDQVLVWNEVQVAEAARYHALPAQTVTPAGAPVFDWMFSTKYLVSREEFCLSVGLDPGRPYLLYAASSPINCEDETRIVGNLREELDRLAPGEIQILVRPYPSNQTAWQNFTLTDVRVGFPPLAGRRQVKSNLYNTLYHAAAMAGLNTSVFLEAAILKRPGLTLLFKEADHDAAPAKHTQFPHFAYLLQGDFLEVAENEADCAEKIVRIVRGEDRKRDLRTAFVQSFVRPNGLEAPAGAAVVDLLERMASSPTSLAAVKPGRQAVSSPAARPAATIR